MTDRNTKDPGSRHGTRLFRGLDQHDSLPFQPGPLIRGADHYQAKPGDLLANAKPDPLLQPGRFGRIFAKSNYKPDPGAIHELAESMREDNIPTGDNPDIPLGLVFLGQFVDHDLTLDATSQFGKTQDPDATHDFRTPNFDLDNVYGAGPGVSRHMYSVTPPDDKNPVKLLIDAGREFDLPRNSQNTALIGDLRNDENFLVSQLHLAFLKFHNAVVDIVRAEAPARYQGPAGNSLLFMEASRRVRWHYQWILVHEFLPKIVGADVVNDVLKGRKLFRWEHMGSKYPYMPVEFSTACYRLGHTMLRQDYVVNDSTHMDLFQLPVFGNPRINGPEEKLDFTKFFDFPGMPPAQRARKFDARITAPVFALPFIDPKQDPPISLAERNMLRSMIFGVPSGQEVATHMKAAGIPVHVHSNAELGISEKLSRGLHDQAPLFYYMLKESEFAPYDGRRLGPVGGRIVAEVFIGILQGIAGNYLADSPRWTPTLGPTPGAFTMVDLLTIARA